MSKQGMSEYDLKEMYDEMLDDVYGEVSIGGLTYLTSRAMQEVDPTAYRCGFSDWLDSQLSEGILFEANGEYFDEDPDAE